MKRLNLLLMMMVIFILCVQSAYATILSWDENIDVTDCDGYYVVYYQTDEITEWQELWKSEDGSVLQITLEDQTFGDNGPQCGVTYTLSVKAFNAYGNSSDYSETVTYSIKTPNEVVISQACDVLSISHDFTYTDSMTLYISGNGVTTSSKVGVGTTSVNLIDLGLADGTYTISLSAFSSTECQTSSNTITYVRGSLPSVSNIRLVTTTAR